MPCNTSYTRFIFGRFFICTIIWYAFLYALLFAQNFILVKSGCYTQVPMLRLTPSIGVRTSKLKQPLVRSEVAFSWIDWTGWYTKSREIKTTGLGVNQHQAGYWIDLVNTKALLEWNGYREALAIPQRCSSKADANQGVHLGGSERYAYAI
jgi:hypothetical protein